MIHAATTTLPVRKREQAPRTPGAGATLPRPIIREAFGLRPACRRFSSRRGEVTDNDPCRDHDGPSVADYQSGTQRMDTLQHPIGLKLVDKEVSALWFSRNERSDD